MYGAQFSAMAAQSPGVFERPPPRRITSGSMRLMTVDNDKAHKLLQKNLKNLYDLFMSLKGDGNDEDPMFTTKALNCAACAKGVQNMLGFSADHVSHQNFPFKEPGQRMGKLGQGFSKVYN